LILAFSMLKQAKFSKSKIAAKRRGGYKINAKKDAVSPGD
jgi:hypothetical protein